VLESAPESVVLVYPRTILIDPDDTVISEYDDRLDLRMASPSKRLGHLVRNIRLANAVEGLMRMAVLRETGLFRPLPCSDNLLLAELSLRGEFWEIPEPLYKRRIHVESHAQVHQNLRDRMRWIDPFRGSWSASFPVTRLVIEHLRIIRDSPISAREKLEAVRCYLPAHAIARTRHRTFRMRAGLHRAASYVRRRA
jgi:hypothetical protein